jgi:uncharacterized protein (TIGR03435 family)
MPVNDFERRAIVYAVALLLLGSTTFAQTGATENLPKFDVVSIKLHEDEGMSRMGIGFGTTPDGLSFKGGSLDMLLQMAFDVPRDRLLNDSEWAKSSRFDVEVKVAPEDSPRLQALTRQQRWAMLIPALEDRCALSFHRERRDLQVYTLVLAKSGPKLKEAAPANSDVITLGSTGPAQAAQPPAMSFSSKGMTIWARGATMDSLAQMLSQQMGTTVVDKTGLTGKYNYELSWMPDEDSLQLMGLPIPGPPPGGSGQSQQPVGPSIFSALQEQAGLKLEMHKEPVDVIVIDHMEKPSAN